jgi:hypothetical protein
MVAKDPVALFFYNRTKMEDIDREIDVVRIEIQEALFFIDEILLQPFSSILNEYARALMRKADLCKSILQDLQDIKIGIINEKLALLADIGL